VGRVVQALGAGALVPVSLALVGDLFPPMRRARPLGLVAAVDTLGWVLGHLYGGLLVQYMHWHWLFWINVPLTALTIVLVLWALRKVPQQRASGRFDFLGTALIVAALTCLNLGLGANIDIGSTTSNFDQLSPLPPNFGPMMALTAVFFLGFVLVESRVKDPLVNLRMFRQRNISAGALVNLFVGFCILIGLVSVPILVNVRAENASALTEAALKVGLLLSTLTVPMALAAVPGGWLSDRIGYRWTTVLGLSLAIFGFGWVWQTWTPSISEGLIAVQMAFIGVGLGLTFSPISAAVINAAHEDERGVASALVIILRMIGMTVSVSTLTTLSLQRVNILVAQILGEVVDPYTAIETYTEVTVQVLGELGLVGVIVCGVALIPALLLREDPVLVGEEDR
jgi:MFS family permease